MKQKLGRTLLLVCIVVILWMGLRISRQSIKVNALQEEIKNTVDVSEEKRERLRDIVSSIVILREEKAIICEEMTPEELTVDLIEYCWIPLSSN